MISSRSLSDLGRNDKLPLPLVTLVLLAALLVMAPHAMTFTPFAGIYTFGTYKAPYESDPVQNQRIGLISFGLCATVIASLELCFFLLRRSPVPSVLTSVTATFACAVIGWRSFPYWVTGVYAAYSGRVPWADFDPKGLIPMAWLGDFWALSVLLLYPAALAVAPAGILASILFVRRGLPLFATTPAACVAIAFLFLFGFSPGYVSWVLD